MRLVERVLGVSTRINSFVTYEPEDVFYPPLRTFVVRIIFVMGSHNQHVLEFYLPSLIDYLSL